MLFIGSSNQNKILPENNTILRYYGVGAQILKELKIKNMILVSRSKKRIIALKGYGINIKKHNKIMKKKFVLFNQFIMKTLQKNY